MSLQIPIVKSHAIGRMVEHMTAFLHLCVKAIRPEHCTNSHLFNFKPCYKSIIKTLQVTYLLMKGRALIHTFTFPLKLAIFFPTLHA